MAFHSSNENSRELSADIHGRLSVLNITRMPSASSVKRREMRHPRQKARHDRVLATSELVKMLPQQPLLLLCNFPLGNFFPSQNRTKRRRDRGKGEEIARQKSCRRRRRPARPNDRPTGGRGGGQQAVWQAAKRAGLLVGNK